jgi:hypothetical protein
MNSANYYLSFNLSKGILVRHTSLIESELKAPSNVTSNWICIIKFRFLYMFRPCRAILRRSVEDY